MVSADARRRVSALERAVGVSTGGAWCECEHGWRVQVVWTDDELAAVEAADTAALVCERCGRPVRRQVVRVEYGDESEVLDES
jgi:hypothetical protein